MSYNPMSLSGRRILVTGATGGIGQAVASVCARLGATVLVSGRHQESLTHLVETLSAADALPRSTYVTVPFDLSRTDDIPSWLKQLASQHGPLDGIAHVAGIQATRPIQMADAVFMEQVMTTNLFSSLALARGIRQKSVHTDRTSVVFVASSAALRTAPGNVVYAASKGGIVAATKGLGVELLRDGIRVNCVAPALIQTDMSEKFRQMISESAYQKVLDLHPMGIGQPEDVAHALAFLLSDAARWITGSVMCVDGGFLA